MKYVRLLCLLLCLMLLTGCTSAPSAAPQAAEPAPELPVHQQPYEAPIGDAGLQHEAIAALYLPSLDGQRLLAFYETLSLDRSQHPAETIVRALLSHEGNSRVQSLGGHVTLALHGSNPVEVSGSVATVNLTPSALQLTPEELYTVCLALTATLCETDGITHVNVLVAGQPVAMDVMGCLPLGTLTAQIGQELPVLWEQFDARRSPVGVDPSLTPLTAAATLYFPLESGRGFIPQPRRISFTGQRPAQLAEGLIKALSAGADGLSGASDMPDLAAMLRKAPEVVTLDSGAQRLILSFPADFTSRISDAGADPACCIAAMVTTLTTFIPSLQQVCILTGDGALTSVYTPALGSLLFPGGLHTRQDYISWLMDQATLYVLDDGRLAAHQAALPGRSAASPRQLLLTLAAVDGDRAVLPAGLTDADILGLSVEDNTLLIHLSARYAECIRLSSLDQRMMAYAVVGTMCEHLQVKRVRFFFGSEETASLGSELLWSGEFLHNPGLTGGAP